MNNLLSYCGLVDEKIRASDKDLVPVIWVLYLWFQNCLNQGCVNGTFSCKHLNQLLSVSKEEGCALKYLVFPCVSGLTLTLSRLTVGWPWAFLR